MSDKDNMRCCFLHVLRVEYDDEIEIVRCHKDNGDVPRGTFCSEGCHVWYCERHYGDKGSDKCCMCRAPMTL